MRNLLRLVSDAVLRKTRTSPPSVIKRLARLAIRRPRPAGPGMREGPTPRAPPSARNRYVTASGARRNVIQHTVHRPVGGLYPAVTTFNMDLRALCGRRSKDVQDTTCMEGTQRTGPVWYVTVVSAARGGSADGLQYGLRPVESSPVGARRGDARAAVGAHGSRADRDWKQPASKGRRQRGAAGPCRVGRSSRRICARGSPMSHAYNYAHFPQDLDSPLFTPFPQNLRVGTQAPDGELIRLDDGASTSVRVLGGEHRGHRVRLRHLTVLRAGGAGPGRLGEALRGYGLCLRVRLCA